MDIGSCQKDTIQKIQDYLDGCITDEDVSKWALNVIVETKKLKSLHPSVNGGAKVYHLAGG